MGRCNTKRTSSKIFVYIFICNNFDVQWFCRANINCKNFTNIFLVTFIIWVHRYCSIAQLGFWSSGRNSYREIFGIFKIIQLGRSLYIYQFIIATSRLSFYRPINYAVAAVNQAIVIHFFENGPHCQISLFIKGVGFPTPIQRSTHFFALVHNRIVALLGEFVYPF